MVENNSAWFQQYLACPDCGIALSGNDQIRCENGHHNQPLTKPFILKPQQPQRVEISLPRTFENLNTILNNIDITPPTVTYDGPRAIRDSSALMSEISSYLAPNSTVLDLGCGPRDQAIAVEHLGHRYVGVDYSNTHADILADAHAIPFQDATFDCILSYAVLEHLHNPFIAIQEITRVLKPGGIYLGTVSQGEPFHASYFHHTAWGVISVINTAPALQLKRLWSSRDTLMALSNMGRYPKAIRLMIRLVSGVHRKLPFLAPRKLRWSQHEKQLDSLYRAASIGFVVQKNG